MHLSLNASSGTRWKKGSLQYPQQWQAELVQMAPPIMHRILASLWRSCSLCREAEELFCMPEKLRKFKTCCVPLRPICKQLRTLQLFRLLRGGGYYVFSEGTWICVLRMVRCLSQDKEADCYYSIMDLISIHSRLSRLQTGLFIAAEDCAREVLRVVESFGEQSCGEVLEKRVAEKCCTRVL